MQSDVLQLQSASLYRDDQLIFSDISFELKGGNHLIIKGNNGSGKTSLIRTLCGLTQLTEGSVLWNHNSIDGIGFRMGDYFDNICNSKEFDICYTIDENLWKGRKNLQLKLIDLKINSKI